MEGNIKFCKKWEKEDWDITPLERTRGILAGTLGGVEPFLKFTTETGEDFGGEGWLPTLDTEMKVSEDNMVLFRYWEKTTKSNRTLNRRTAMGENPKIQILTQEVIRRLGNTSECLPKEDFREIVDKYAQKLIM